MDLLFAAPTPWVWDAEKTFERLKAEKPELVQAAARGEAVVDPEAGVLTHPVAHKAGDVHHTEESEGNASQ